MSLNSLCPCLCYSSFMYFYLHLLQDYVIYSCLVFVLVHVSIMRSDTNSFSSPENGIIKSDKVYEVMLATDRAHFSRCNPYMDSPQSIGTSAHVIIHASQHSLKSNYSLMSEGCTNQIYASLFNQKAIKQPSAPHTWYDFCIL